MKKSKKRKLIIIVSIAVILLVCAVVVILLLNKKDKTDNDKISKYELIQNEQVIFDMADTIGAAGDFVYFYDYPVNYYGEYDVKNDKMLKMPVNNFIANYNFYEGELYCVMADLANNNKLSFVKWDINTGDYEPVYVTPDGVEGLYNFSMSNTGIMFFNERKHKSKVKIGEYLTNEDGFRVNNDLYMYNPETKEKTKLAEGAEMYYVRGDRIYFNRVHESLQEVVYYVEIENPEKVIDTGIVCRTLDAVGRGFSGDFYVDHKGEYIYYSGGTNEYKRKNIKTGEEEIIVTYTDSNGYYASVQEFNGKQIVYVRCAYDNEVGFGAKLFEIDVEKKESKQIWTDTLEELLVDTFIFKGNDDYYLLLTYPAWEININQEHDIVGNRYYLVYKDGTKKLIFDDVDLPRWAGFGT